MDSPRSPPHKADATSEVISMLQENMRYLEDMEEEKLRMQREHEEEREKLQERMEDIVDQYLEQKRELEAKIAADEEAAYRRLEMEKEKARQQMAEFRLACERELAQEKELMEKRMAEYRAEREQLEAEKQALTRQMEQFRVECELEMAQEKEEAARLTQELACQWEAQRKMLEDRASEEMASFRRECEHELAQEKEAMARKMADFRTECEQLEAEKLQLVRQMEQFRVQCEADMAREKEDTARQAEELARHWEEQRGSLEERAGEEMAGLRRECERELAEEKAKMERGMAEYRAEREQLEAEKAELTRQMERFRVECETMMVQEKEETARKTEELAQQWEEQRSMLEERMAEEQELARSEMLHFREVCEREMAEEKEEMSTRMADYQLECSRLEEEKAEMLRKMAEARAEFDLVAREKQEMDRRTTEFQADCERQMEEKEQEIVRKTMEIRAVYEKQVSEEKERAENGLAEARRQSEEQMKAEYQRLAEEQAQMTKSFADFRADCERKTAEEKAQMEKQTAKFYAECHERMGQNETMMTQKAAEFCAEREQMAQEKAQIMQKMDEFRMECEGKMQAEELEMQRKTAELHASFERKIAEEKGAMEKKTAEFFTECQHKMEENEAQMTKKSAEFRRERQRMSEEKAEMTRQMEDFRTECEARMSAEEAEAKRKTAGYRAECQQQVAREKAAAERRIAEAREHTEEQLRTEREVTEHIKVVLRELPPLQTAMELGDLALLEEELWKWREEVLPERFGDCKSVVQAVLKLAKERLFTWRGVDHTWKDILREVETLPNSVVALTQQSQRLFRALKEAQLTKMDLRRSDPRAMDRAVEVLLAWQGRAMAHSNAVQELIVRKVVNWPRLGAFDFTDLDICLRLVDRRESDSEVFLSRVRALVEDENTAPTDLRGLLSHVETMLFFLKYAKSEDLQCTYAEFHKQFPRLDRVVVEFLQAAERDYPPGAEVVALSESRNLLNGHDVSTVLEEIRKPRASPGRKDGLGIFREIFYQWAVAMKSKFNLLVLPHHTQVVCLLTFRRFLESVGQQPKQGIVLPRALIAQVGTGEGKSMIVAAIAIYVVVALRKKAHVVVDDETLLERDFCTFKPLFDMFEVPVADATPGTKTPRRRPISSVLCASEERLQAAGTGEAARCMAARVDPDADICYCEAKHVQSFYASIARGEKRDFEGYDGRVLILDEVDALVIDEEPNEAFVYPNAELSTMATSVAASLKQGSPPLDPAVLPAGRHPAAGRVVSVMQKEWDKGRQLVAGEDFIFGKETGKYCALQAGRANAKAWSLALECRNYQDGFSREILFQERLFVMSRPRVFRKYHCILGLSGSIGSEPERKFLQDTYRAAFFEVPPFLKTCRGAPFHEAVPRPFGEKQQVLYVEASLELQTARVAEVALEARERVPVLVIARDRGHADQLVEYLHQAARSRGLGRVADDLVRSLSRTVYEADPEQWKENLNRSTMPLGDCGAGGGHKSWRVTVTDPRGGRGTDYRVDDAEVDDCGGLLLVPTAVPASQRDWIQFLGRTARQDRQGQFCAVLCAADYEASRVKYGGSLVNGNMDTIKAILAWGDQETAGRIRGSAALYNNGVRMNELCEEVFCRRTDLLGDAPARELLVDACQRHRWMSVQEVDQAFARLPGFDPKKVPSEARDLGRPSEPPAGQVVGSGQPSATAGGGALVVSDAPRIVVFCLDWSASMLSRDTRTPYTRFELCVKCVQQILQNQVRDCDLVGVVCFGPQVTTVVPPTPKGRGGPMLFAKIAGLRPQASGGTCFFDAVAQCLQLLGTPGLSQPEAQRWLICLTDGDDLGSRRENMNGQVVTQMLQAGIPACLNMMMITVGALRQANTRVIGSWVERVRAGGGHGQLLSEKDAGAITMAFKVVAQCLAAEVGGATEC